MTNYIDHPDYKYPLSVLQLQLLMGRMTSDIESVTKNIQSCEEELEAVKDDAEFVAMNELELQNFNEELNRYEASKQSLQLLIDYKAPKICQFCDDNLPVTTTIKGNPSCEPCRDAYYYDY